MIRKPLRWIGSSRNDLRNFPEEARRNIGYALHFAQVGTKHPSAKPLKGYGGAGVLEVIADVAGNTYRTVYTVQFAEAVYVLHAFEKKSKSGIKTPKKALDLIRDRLSRAKEEQLRHTREADDES